LLALQQISHRRPEQPRSNKPVRRANVALEMTPPRRKRHPQALSSLVHGWTGFSPRDNVQQGGSSKLAPSAGIVTPEGTAANPPGDPGESLRSERGPPVATVRHDTSAVEAPSPACRHPHTPVKCRRRAAATAPEAKPRRPSQTTHRPHLL
jgi:hypothetical protein